MAGAASVVGCGDRDRVRRPWRPEAEGTTIGRDLKAAPRGTTIPMTSLGVDLVDRGRGRDSAVAPVDFKEIGRNRGTSAAKSASAK